MCPHLKLIVAAVVFCLVAGPVTAAGGSSGVTLTRQGLTAEILESVFGTGAAGSDGVGTAPTVAPVSVWNLVGTTTARIGSASSTNTFTGMLTLNDDRTYIVQIDNDPGTPEMGVWFENRNKLLLFQQNILAQLLEIEAELSIDLDEPVELALLRGRGKINVKGGVLSIKSAQQLRVDLLESGLSGRFTISTKATGTLVP